MTRMMAVLAAAMLAGPAWAQDVPPAPGDTAPVDYARPSAWICHPGGGAQGAGDGTCAGNLDAVAITAAGLRTHDPFVPAAAPPIDCLYVYPTASDDPTFHSDMTVDASEKETVHAQAARLSGVCRLFAPAYHQVTSAGLRWRMAHGAEDAATADGIVASINAIPYRDVRAAWASYLLHDNHGRGVVLVGHSQGAILLKKLLREEIDGRPAQHLLVGAYLAGNPNLGTGSFRSIGPCRAAGETGCVVAWSSYLEGYAGDRAFGGSREGAALCVDPAAIGGGRGMLKPVMPRPAMAAPGSPPYVEPVGQLSAECVADGKGAVLRVRVEPGRYADLMAAALQHGSSRPSWGLHPMDIRLTQGNMIDDIAAQSAQWAMRHTGANSAAPPR